MKISLFAYSRKGCETARKVQKLLPDEEVSSWCPARFLEGPEEGQEPLSELFSPIPKAFRPFYGERFADSDAMIFVSACGIAVREVAPFVKSKKTDPAVLCVDDHARFVIPVLSGHIGGANDLALLLAEKLGAVPVITTGTDISGRFSVDAWAARQGFAISNMGYAKEVSAKILEEDVPMMSALPVEGELPNGVVMVPSKLPDGRTSDGKTPPTGIYIGWEKAAPFAHTLRLIPKVLHLGIGCRRGTKAEEIRRAVTEVLAENGIDKRAVKCLASIDLKSGEEGLLQYSKEEQLPAAFYSAEELRSVEGDFAPSEFVKSVTGVDNVCERAAVIKADALIVGKTAKNGVTVAIAAERMPIRF